MSLLQKSPSAYLHSLFQRRQAISRDWSATVIQRCVRRWLGRARAARVRSARSAAWHGAARTIQRRWRAYAAEKRRYEATYSRLVRKLRQEQLATALIIAELQAQTQRVRLPTAAVAAATPTSRAAITMATSATRERARTKAFPPLYVA